MLRTETPDEKAIAQKVADIASIQAAGKQIWIKHWFQVNKLLTAEQQKVWKRALQFAGRQAAARLMQERTDFPRGWRRR
jgi:predicted phosphohydrolase